MLKTAAQLKNSCPTIENINSYYLSQKALYDTYDTQQEIYLQSKIDEIKAAVSNQKSVCAWKVVNDITGRKKNNKAKIKATSGEERIKLWHNHFKDLLGKPPESKTSTITNISNLLNIETEIFTKYELEKAIKSIKNGKACGLDEIPVEIWKIPKFQEILLFSCNEVYEQNTISIWNKGCIIPLPKKGDLTSTNNYRGITLTCIAAKIYNLMLLNRIRPEVDKILRKNQNGFRTNRSTTGQILTVRRIIEGVNEKNLTATLLFIDFSKAFDSIHRGKMAEILKAYGIPEMIINAIMIAYKDTKSIVRSDDGDTEFINITGGVLQGDTLAPFIFIICLDYVLKMSLDRDNVLGFTLSERKSRRHPAIKITDVDYADDLAIVTDKTSEATILLHKIENTAKEIGLNINAGKTEFISINQGENEKIKSQSFRFHTSRKDGRDS